jgi:hypothetical protein
MKQRLTSLSLYLVIIAALTASVVQLTQAEIVNPEQAQRIDLSQPVLPETFPWPVKSIDTQVVSKHWIDVPKESIREQVRLLKELNVNYIAIATHYDRVDEMQMWADEIHAQGLNVWFRSHWEGWEGDNNKPAIMTPDEYLRKTKDFVIAHPSLFREGDAFTVAVEPENVGVGLGRRFISWDEYKEFLLKQVIVAKEAFAEIDMDNKVHTNWLSVNGWVAMNVLDQELVDQLGLIVVDHYSVQSNTIGTLDDPAKIVRDMNNDLDEIYQKWKKPILLGEWGYQIYQEIDEDTQATVIKGVLEMLATKPYLIGVNYWTHMGNHARIIGDEQGSNLQYRKAAAVIKEVYSGN